MATHSSMAAWRSPWTEDPGGLPSMESQRVGHDWATNTLALNEILSFKAPLLTLFSQMVVQVSFLLPTAT